MALYPLHPPHVRYKGRAKGVDRLRKVAEMRRLGEQIVAYVNREMEGCSDGESRMFSYGAVASILKIEPADVENVLGELGGGGNGITVVRRG